MNPQSNEQLGHQLPTPVEHSALPEATPKAAEQGQNVQESVAANTISQPPQTLPLPPAPAAAQSTQQQPIAASSTTTNDVPSTADDADLIEKEWVVKAKSIVNNTLDDPYNQSKQLTAIKADYLQKRYNKNLKLSE